MSDKETIIINKKGIPVATIYGEINTDIIANFFIKTPIKNIKKDTK